MIDSERTRRLNLWKLLLNRYGSQQVKPSILNKLKIYYGGAGIWRDATNTALNEQGVTIGVLHTGRHYADDLSSEGIFYHYPHTNRPPSADQNEIQATKAARKLNLPIFVITHNEKNNTLRDVYLGWVADWNDGEETFLILFQSTPPEEPIKVEDQDSEEFVLFDNRVPKRGMRNVREKPLQFRFKVFQRYGAKCALCGVSVEELLEAIHIVPKSKHGTDDPRNGLTLCVLHHKAFDVGLIGIEPESTQIKLLSSQGISKEALGIEFNDLAHLPRLPHKDALHWNWKQFQKKL